MFTELEMQEMRAGETEDRPDLCDIFEPAEPTAEDYGQSSADPLVALVTDEPCLFYATQGMFSEGVAASQTQEEGDFKIELRHTLPRPSGQAVFRVESFSNALTVTGATNAEPIILTVANHGLRDGNRVSVRDVLGNLAANGKWVVTVIDANSFSLNDSEGNGSYLSGGLVRQLLDYEKAGNRDYSYSIATIFDLKRAGGM